MSIKVMIVDDDPMVAEINRFYVEKIEGLELVCTAFNVTEAKELLKKEQVGIALLDIFLGNGNGIEILKFIRDEKIPCQVIMVSAAKDKEHINSAINYGVCDYLVKPFSFERFERSIELAKQRINKFQKETYEQRDLDEVLFANGKQVSFEKLPKGLDQKTLMRILQVVEDMGDKFTIVDISKNTELSRVSVKKYLDYMCAENMLEEQYSYGNIGRPTLIYQAVSKEK